VKSIRYYLVIALLATIALGNFVAAVYGYRSSMQAAQALLDTQLADTAAMLQALPPPLNPVVSQPSERLAYQVWSESGELILRTDNSDASPISELDPGYRDENFAGRRWRVLSRFDDNQRRWILVAERIDIRTELADEIILRAVVPIVVSMPLIAAIVWLIVGNGLSLIRKLAGELREKRADDLSRLTTSDPPVELAPVVDAINDLLRRLNESILRERRFSADAAHELRTPLSALKVHVHNLRAELPGHDDALRVLDRDVGRLSHLIEQIMLLYRLTPEHYQAKMETIALLPLAQAVISDLYPVVEAKQQTISLDGNPESITGDEPSLVILLRNLVLNASKYSPAGASIRIEVGRNDFGICVGVEDTGPGIPLPEIRRVFDRFYRVGGDRHASSEDGCGLGLAIVRHIANLHHASMHIENNADGPGLTVSVTFPFDFEAPLFGERHAI
jgi:two-component system sensor histidine kinase QseC